MRSRVTMMCNHHGAHQALDQQRAQETPGRGHLRNGGLAQDVRTRKDREGASYNTILQGGTGSTTQRVPVKYQFRLPICTYDAPPCGPSVRVGELAKSSKPHTAFYSAALFIRLVLLLQGITPHLVGVQGEVQVSQAAATQLAHTSFLCTCPESPCNKGVPCHRWRV